MGYIDKPLQSIYDVALVVVDIHLSFHANLRLA
jgi:hypothetical protein